jgi:hypothetical protein
LISDIWKEAEPIYKEGKLVEGKCIHCHQIFAASRETGTSHMQRHLKVCEAKTAMNDMVAKIGRPDGIYPNWKFIPKLARRKLLKRISTTSEYRCFLYSLSIPSFAFLDDPYSWFRSTIFHQPASRNSYTTCCC